RGRLPVGAGADGPRPRRRGRGPGARRRLGRRGSRGGRPPAGRGGAMLSVRAALFYAGYTVATIVWGTLGTLLGWLFPYRLRFRLVGGCCTAFCVYWRRLAGGIGVGVIGRENLPERPCIVRCRHESTGETLFLQQLFVPQATLIKRELLH